ncbi:hypothetical protein L6452_39161 [Arctium lappa]|uniref:Uncharacterized protein n=1 Tax=Arctium lappa TaxID=4217 RepID=A0ACB8XS91_ARCLA|nr:hypothetical protein L6452_39161 [Arctium lappa]
MKRMKKRRPDRPLPLSSLLPQHKQNTTFAAIPLLPWNQWSALPTSSLAAITGILYLLGWPIILNILAYSLLDLLLLPWVLLKVLTHRCQCNSTQQVLRGHHHHICLWCLNSFYL